MARITIVGSRLSPFVEKVVRALDYKRLAYELAVPGDPREIARANPTTAKMPFMRLDGGLVYDSTFILRRLDEIAPEPPLWSSDPAIAARQRLLEDWSDESLYWLVMALRWCSENEARTAAELAPFLPALVRPFALPITRRLIGRTTRVQGTGRLPYDVLVREAGHRLDDLVLLLGRDPFFHGPRPSVADFAVYGQLSAGCRDATPDFRECVADRPALGDFMKRLEDVTAS